MLDNVLGSRVFTLQNSQLFANETGDFNPIHIDQTVASQTVFGTCIVHGMHLLLWGLDRFFDVTQRKATVVEVSCVFRRAVLINELVECRSFSHPSAEVQELRMLIMGVEVAAIKFTLTNEFSEEPVNCSNRSGVEVTQAIPSDPLKSDLHSLSGGWVLPRLSKKLITNFPSLLKLQGEIFIQSMAQLSVLVGMRCPGLHSLISEFTLTRKNVYKKATKLEFSVKKFDTRFSLVQISVLSGPFEGLVSCFVRSRKVKQSSIEALSEKLKPLLKNNPFEGHKPLVIGGSRGLGQVTCKILALGGASPVFTYLRDVTGAESVLEEILRYGLEAEARQFDVLGSDEERKVLVAETKATNLYYYATPAIFLGNREVFSKKLLYRFTKFYISGLAQLVSDMVPQGLSSVCAPSTTALNDKMPGMLEYCVAKAGMEYYCESMASSHMDVKFVVPRFPRLETDQTTNFVSVHNEDPVQYILNSVLKTQGVEALSYKYYDSSGR